MGKPVTPSNTPLVPQTPPPANRLAKMAKTILPVTNPLVPGKAVPRKANSISDHQRKVSNTEEGKTLSLRPGSSPYAPIPIALHGKAPIILTQPKPDLVPDNSSQPHMPVVSPKGPPPMHPPPKYSTLPPLPLNLTPSSVPRQPRTSLPKSLSKKKKKNSVRIYSNDVVSQEEERAMHPKYSAYLDKRITSLSESIKES